ncbi:MAG: PIN domain-containing protein [Thermoanaerobaculia bacterium]
MKFLVDANVFSELTRPQPDSRVVRWMTEHERELAIDPVILGELRFGILLLPAGKRRERLEQWFLEVVERVQCLLFDADCGLRWAELLAKLRSAGRSMPIKDSLIAATALTHRLTVVTRNRRDFEPTGVEIVDPFAENATAR